VSPIANAMGAAATRLEAGWARPAARRGRDRHGIDLSGEKHGTSEFTIGNSPIDRYTVSIAPTADGMPQKQQITNLKR
jgi:hypothetical protein